MRDIVGCTTRRVELAGAESRSDGYYRNDRLVDGVWSICRHGLIEPKRKARPEEEIQVLGVVDAVRQSLEMVRPQPTTVTGGLQETRPWRRQ